MRLASESHRRLSEARTSPHAVHIFRVGPRRWGTVRKHYGGLQSFRSMREVRRPRPYGPGSPIIKHVPVGLTHQRPHSAKSGHCGRACRKDQPAEYHAAMLVSKAFCNSEARLASAHCGSEPDAVRSTMASSPRTVWKVFARVVHQKQKADPKAGPLGLYTLSRHTEAPSPQRR